MSTIAAQRLTAQQAESLWRTWKTQRDSSARDRLVLSYTPMVRYLAAKKIRELPAHCELDDLASAGLVALIEAVDRFEPLKGATFEQYAWTRVSGAIRDDLRRQDWASRSVRRIARQVERARDDFYVKTGRFPNDEELAEKLEIPLDELRTHYEELDRAELSSLNAPTRSGDDADLEIGDTIEAPMGEHEPERATLASERSAIMREAISHLSEREQTILRLVHVEELQGAEIGARLGVSESRVSQILASARQKLRQHVQSYDLAA
ncbi:MAG: polymerase sigma factor FliA [Gaiellaceae bacterium]|nr:polymerase sigma factor FliA [Gaiellaceae bacterium]